MKVLVDTSVWSLALRRNKIVDRNDTTKNLTQLILDSMVVMIGPVRQELLSGISKDEDYAILKNKLKLFPDLPLNTHDYETAAGFFNSCKKNGVQGTHIDFLICAAAVNNDLIIYTTDKDFYHYAKHIPIRLLN
jgi:predicted nucleic acid-binding protein